jgi:uncharacterized protein YbjQ (UPF0145 family)
MQQAQMQKAVRVYTADAVVGYTVVTTLGFVAGSTVRGRNAAVDCCSEWQNCFGGELSFYTDLLDTSRDQAMARMCTAAAKLGANAVIACHITTANVAPQVCEVLVYGTAVVLEPVAVMLPY